MISLKPSSYLGGPGTNTNTMMNAEISLEGSFLFTVRSRAYSQSILELEGAARCSGYRVTVTVLMWGMNLTPILRVK